MNAYHMERAGVLLAGFFGGASLALAIAPGNVALSVVAGVAAGLFAQAFFVACYGGPASWPRPDRWPPHNRRPH